MHNPLNILQKQEDLLKLEETLLNIKSLTFLNILQPLLKVRLFRNANL